MMIGSENKTLSQFSIGILVGVGTRTLALLQRLQLATIEDLLFHLPIRYEDRTRITPINKLHLGQSALIEGKIISVVEKKRPRPLLTCRLSDQTGIIDLRFFHYTENQRQKLSNPQAQIRCFGEIRANFAGQLEIIHPEYTFVSQAQVMTLSEHLTPVYPTVKGLSQVLFRKLIDQALQYLHKYPPQELLPEAILNQFRLPNLIEALEYIHHPAKDCEQDVLLSGQHIMQRRLAFEELMAHQLGLQQLRHKIKVEHSPILKDNHSLIKKFINSLPFQLTRAQQQVIKEIEDDLQIGRPMLRLLQGDVGSGKTIVAGIALLYAVANGYQGALMAPTELLAEQHFQNFRKWFNSLGIEVGYLSGKQNAGERHSELGRIRDGSCQIIIGTHALFQDEVNFFNLAIIVIDEQHRFGVHQRLALQKKSNLSKELLPHQLIMSATPIPRTLAMTIYADLDVSIIDELPPGRTPVETVLVSNKRREEVIKRVQIACQNKCQVYWVCTLIDESEVLQCQAAEATMQSLHHALPELRIGLVHSRLKNVEKVKQMQTFKMGQLDLLVATTVIEVGVDVANASVMIIENPERLGLAQLHQLRGRVGRGAAKSYCVLLYQEPLSQLARQRLNIMRQTTDGFEIAHQDLEIRGPGEVLGTRQAGLLRLRVADLIRDKDLLDQVHYAATLIVKEYPQLIPLCIKRWLAGKDRYMQV